jgi:hypothetical protein
MVDGRELRRATRRIVQEAEQWHLGNRIKDGFLAGNPKSRDPGSEDWGNGHQNSSLSASVEML